MATTVAAQLKQCHMIIGGEKVVASGKIEIQHNPATGEPQAEIAWSTAQEVSRAIEDAHRAYASWSRTPVLQRARMLFKYRELIDKHADELCAMVTEEHGKTLDESRASLMRGLESVEFACSAPTLMMGETLERVGTGTDGHTLRVPIGVCAGITPFNFPAMVPLWMFPIAIAMGNTFVLKPSEKVPRTAVRMVELLLEAGCPAGVVNVVHGGKETVDTLLTHPLIKGVSFVGSSAVAKYIYTTGCANGKRVQALGGAKNHSVVMPDCDLPSTVASVMASSFGCAGERCVATSVILAVGDAGDKLVPALVTAGNNLKCGAGEAKGVEMGPLVTGEHKKKVMGYIDVGEKEGAKLARDGRKDKLTNEPGNFVGATVFDHVKPSMKIAREEIFGPVLSVIRVKDLDEALKVIEECEYGNASSIYTSSGVTAHDFTERTTTGMVGVNIGVPAPSPIFTFAGWRGSFFGDLHALGKDAAKFYTETKVVTSRWV